MNVSFNPVNNLYSKPSFRAVSQDWKSRSEKEKQDSVLTAKTKKTIEECIYIVLGASIIYFTAKNLFIKRQDVKKSVVEGVEKPFRTNVKKLIEKLTGQVKGETPAKEKVSENSKDLLTRKILIDHRAVNLYDLWNKNVLNPEDLIRP